MRHYDVLVIGCGIAGACVARELARYSLDVAVVESGLDIAQGATRANSGIVHAGFDPKPGTAMAYYNVRGSHMYEQWAQELGFHYKRNGSLVLAFTDEELHTIHELYDRGQQNAVRDLRILDAQEVLKREPRVSASVRGALYAPTAAICDPYKVAFCAAENAAQNGVDFYFDTRVMRVTKQDNQGSSYRIECTHERQFSASVVVNAAGVYADQIHAMVSKEPLTIHPRRGEYCVFDTEDGSLFSHTIFQAPTVWGKGVLVTPTVHGNLLVGPNAQDQDSKEDASTTSEGLKEIITKAQKTYPQLSLSGLISNFAGLRARGDRHDFVIGEPLDAHGFYDIAAFASPGLTSAPAVGQHLAQQIAHALHADIRSDFNPILNLPRHFHDMSDEDIQKAIHRDARMGHMVCRCRQVTEADIVATLHTTLPVLCLDAIKWRTEAMMGACHGGFCEPEIAKIVARELGVMPHELPKRLAQGAIVVHAPESYGTCVTQEALALPEAIQHEYDVVVVGGGAAGIAAAVSAAKNQVRVLMVDREPQQGGILKQCIHNGFGLHRFSCELTGPEYAQRELDVFHSLPIDLVSNASVLDLGQRSDGAHYIKIVSPAGLQTIVARAVVLATGSRERGAGALNMSGTRPAGVFSAGSAQNFMNLQGCVPGKRVVILGSGDIGLIMARRLTFAGAHVVGVYEINSQPSGLRRNIVQCLEDFDIELHTSQTIIALQGQERLEAVVVAHVDPKTRAVIPGTEKTVACDTLLLSVGLIPENTIAQNAGIPLSPVTNGPEVNQHFETRMPGVFSCGNALHIHDLVDFVSQEGDSAGAAAARYAVGQRMHGTQITVEPGYGVRYVVPQRLQIPASMQPQSADVALEPSQGVVTMRFRTTESFEHATIVVEALDAAGQVTQIVRRKVLIAVPAEMQSVRVKMDACIDAQRVRVRVMPHES